MCVLTCLIDEPPRTAESVRLTVDIDADISTLTQFPCERIHRSSSRAGARSATGSTATRSRSAITGFICKIFGFEGKCVFVCVCYAFS